MSDVYRPGVGMMLINRDGKVWVGQRIDNPTDAWQMPQGGLDPGEDALEGALRELEEETGIPRDLVEILDRAKEELTYDLPEELIGRIWNGNYRGQRQTWFLARFLGSDAEVRIGTDQPEFSAWKWADPRDLPNLIVPFKRKLYQDLVDAFADWL